MADALGVGAQLNRRSTTTSLDEPAQSDEGEKFLIGDVLSLDEDDPAQKALRKLDWEFFLSGLMDREKSVVELLLAGHTASQIARLLKIDPSTVRYFKHRLAEKILEFMGPDNAGYLGTVSTYIHLNPARAGLIVIGKEPLKGYRWSSYPWYLKPARNRPAWLERGRVMGALRLKAEDRRGYEAYLEGRVLELGLPAGRTELEGQWKALRRGWYLGSESFGARLREKIGRLVRGWRRESHSDAAKREHGEQAAEQLLQAGLVALGLTAEELVLGLRVTPEKAALACWVRELTTVSLRWVSERLEMGHYTNAGRGPRKMSAGDVRKTRQARSKLGTIAAKHD